MKNYLLVLVFIAGLASGFTLGYGRGMIWVAETQAKWERAELSLAYTLLALREEKARNLSTTTR